MECVSYFMMIGHSTLLDHGVMASLLNQFHFCLQFLLWAKDRMSDVNMVVYALKLDGVFNYTMKKLYFPGNIAILQPEHRNITWGKKPN